MNKKAPAPGIGMWWQSLFDGFNKRNGFDKPKCVKPGLRRWQHSTGPRPANDTFPAIFEIFTDGMPLAFNFREEIDSPKR